MLLKALGKVPNFNTPESTPKKKPRATPIAISVIKYPFPVQRASFLSHSSPSPKPNLTVADPPRLTIAKTNLTVTNPPRLTVAKTQTYCPRSTSPHRHQNPTLPSPIHLASPSPKPTQNHDDSDANSEDSDVGRDDLDAICDDSGVVRDDLDAICNDLDAVCSQRFRRHSRRFKSPIVGDDIMRQFPTLPMTLQLPTLPTTCNG